MMQESIIVGENTEYPLNGLLTLPEKLMDPAPAVVMVHGSGPSNMDEKIMKLTPFKDLAEGLAKHGIASIRYDKRTFAYARKMAKECPTVRVETIDDALLAIALLRRDPRIDSDRSCILGHSMGAMLAPRIDAEGGDVKGFVLMAGTPYRLEDVVLRQLRQAGSSKSALKWIVRLEHRLFAKKFATLYQMSDDDAKKKKFAGNLSLYYFKEMGQRTAADYLMDTDKPALILQGGRDFQTLAEDDFEKFRELLNGRKNTVFKLYPALNHAFVNALCDDILKTSKEYGVERHIGEDVIADIAEFIHDNA